MAGSSLLALIDDITTVLDDVALLTKVAAKKTAGVVGDDLAVNANQVTGVEPRRELPVVWAVAKGSLLNKAILVPAALVISAVVPWALTPLLMLGGLFLCYEAFEKVAHKFLHSKRSEDEAHRAELEQALADPKVDLVAFEKEKIKGAIRTDFILSAEIIAITLGTAAGETLSRQAGVLVIIALAMTVGVYGLVAAIVKFDDVGLYLTKRTGDRPTVRLAHAFGRGILRCDAVVHEGADRARHAGDVPGRRRHPDPWAARPGGPDRVGGAGRGHGARDRRLPARQPAGAGQPLRRPGRRRARPRRGIGRVEAARPQGASCARDVMTGGVGVMPSGSFPTVASWPTIPPGRT